MFAVIVVVASGAADSRRVSVASDVYLTFCNGTTGDLAFVFADSINLDDLDAAMVGRFRVMPT